MHALMNGVKRGYSSNEAVWEVATKLASNRTTSHPVKQGRIQAI